MNNGKQTFSTKNDAVLRTNRRCIPSSSNIPNGRSKIDPWRLLEFERVCKNINDALCAATNTKNTSSYSTCWGHKIRLTDKTNMQNRAARIVTNSPYDASALPLIGSLGWLTIRELIDFETSKMVYKSLNALAPDYLRNLFQKVSEATNRQLRNSKTDLRLPLLRTSTGQKSFAYRGAKVWSDLDSVVKASASFSSFRRNYETKL